MSDIFLHSVIHTHTPTHTHTHIHIYICVCVCLCQRYKTACLHIETTYKLIQMGKKEFSCFDILYVSKDDIVNKFTEFTPGKASIICS